jgi:hypothetical protein
MTGQTQASEFDLAWASLDGLSRQEIADLIKGHVSPRDAEAFAVLIEGLSADAVRFLSARALVRLRLVPHA